jgi:hypothetical protein
VIPLSEHLDQRINVVSLVTKQGNWIGAVDQLLRAGQIVGLSRGEQQFDGIAQGIDEGMDFVVSPRRIGRSLVRRFFSRTGAVRMCAHDGGVNHHVFIVMVARQQLENAFENSALRPSAETLVDDFPIAETPRKITPWNAGSIPVQNRLDEQPIIRRRAADMAFAARQKILDPIPLVVT